MSVSPAINSAVQAQQCAVTMGEFNSKTATVQEQQAYASCVDFVHPQPMSPAVIVALKVVFVIALLGGVLGFLIGDNSYRPDLSDRFLSFAKFFFLAPIIVGFIGAIGYGIYWLFA
jgi:hypothetical protein